ncbi:hypothetical protein [Arenimonas fontis]|uniref:Uncharacterized protein n=1 Tax=Arenimonas fontis TaxID=2608255 RepID=A0A5B2ZBV1_9GAMM|nr:hypothetical protein [Arenimonas fontis]KAA2284664.1 hypothetical protein F0415_08160 [Arenimonas fontis]
MTFLKFILGVGLLVYAYRAYVTGEVRAGRSGLRLYTPTRKDNPIAFHFFVCLYLFCGFALLIWGVLVLAGVAEPMRLN